VIWSPKMFPRVETKDPAEVRREVRSIYASMFPAADPEFVSEVFLWALDAFSGRYANYQAIDARYHDLEHTLQGTLCFARLLQGYHRSPTEPHLTQRIVELGLIAILLHDTGYLKTREDTEGTGAKYTLTHVNRSADFAKRLLSEKGFAAEEIRSIQNMIRCTGVNVDLSRIPFGSELEKIIGFSLGTADLLGQMAAGDYVEKLGILFSEFEESARFNSGKYTSAGAFASVQELRSKTPMFWERYVLPKIKGDFLALFRFLGRPAPSEENEYVQRIGANLARLQRELDETATAAA
jgi:hypothetical protein